MPVTFGGRQISFGVWYDLRNPPSAGRDMAALYASTLEHIRYAEQLGFDDVWTSEHHFIEDGYSPSLLPICAAIAAQTSRVRIGTNVLLLPLHDPLRIAEDAATVDLISGGRFDLGVANGYKLEEFTGFAIDRRTRATRLEEAIEVIRRSWTPGPFTFEGRHYNYFDVDVTPKPAQDPMPLWIGGFAEAAVRRAARLGDGLLAAANVIPTFLEEWRAQNRGPDPERIAISLPWALIAEDPDAAWAEIGPAILYQSQNYARWFAAAGQPRFPSVPESVDAIRAARPDVVVTPERAREIVETMAATIPASHFYWWAVPPGVAPEATYASIELFARAVLGRR